MTGKRVATILVTILVAASARDSHADEGGVSFWLPGQFASFAAVAPEPGFSFSTQSYFYTGSADGDALLKRGNILSAGLETNFFAQFLTPAWAPHFEILGARPSLSLTFFPGWNGTSANIHGGLGSDFQSDTASGFGDLYPLAQLFWSSGVHNWMTYATGNIPVGTYDPNRLSNLGIGHAAIDFGGAYTYLNARTGWEFSATTGVTINFENPDTHYKNGVDWHLDAGASRFLTERLFVGVVGYAYAQMTADQGQPPAFGPVKSNTFALGPQIGYEFTAGGVPIFVDLRGYLEFAVQDRTKGDSIFLEIGLPLSGLFGKRAQGR